MSNVAIIAAFPRWLAITGGGVDVVIDGRTAIKGVQTDEQNAVGFGATIDAAETSGLRVLASEAGNVTATSRITVDGDAVFLTDVPHMDPTRTLLILAYTKTQPVDDEVM